MKNGERSRLQFDEQDYELVELVNEFVRKGKEKYHERARKLFNPFLHPRGIKELAAPRQQRIAYAVVRLIESLDAGKANARLDALRSLHDELVEGGGHALRLNTGRVLLEIMKHLVRERGHPARQVELAHEFFAAVSGRPRVIRRHLEEYHLLEMSEDWNQVAFDHHVHDANTKGRKSPTHLVVDAWIKGIREMTVVYYHLMSPDAVSELIEASEIMGVTVRPGVEVSARFRGKYVQFIWVPRGLHGAREYLEFVSKPAIRRFFDEGREVLTYSKRHVLDLLGSFNRNHLARLNEEHGLALEPLDEDDFLHFVGIGQPSISHLAEYINLQLAEQVEARLPALRQAWQRSTGSERAELEARVARLDRLTPEAIAKGCLWAEANPDVEDIQVPHDGAGVPALLRQSPPELLERLRELRSGSRVTLNPSNLTHADVLEILYDGQGAITHVELFNLKDHRRKRNPHIGRISELIGVLNGGNPIACKRFIRETIAEVERGDEPAEAREARLVKLRQILGDIQRLLSFYARDRLGARVGSDSIGRAREWSGMGIAVLSTLPPRARRSYRRRPGTREVVPVQAETVLRTTWTPLTSHIRSLDLAFRLLRRLPGLRGLGYHREDEHVVLPAATRLAAEGNLVTLGGTPEHKGNGFSLRAPEEGARARGLRWRFLGTRTRGLLKIALGFVPALLTFALTKDWWLLAWFGAFIWFGITGLRNILQSIVGGAGVLRSQLLKWRDLVSWGRVADSLLYTGFSVPLLDWLVKSVALDRGLGITTATAPLALYTVMALANGAYLVAHNVFRGLPRAAALGNFFRTVLSIPLAFALNAAVLHLLEARGLEAAAANAVLQNWAAVIGKLASDTVAAFIEGAADRNVNIRLRHKDYRAKIAQLLDVHGRLEAMFPETDVVACLASPKQFFRTVGKEAQALETQQIINALDLMYFWMYQPRARAVFEGQLAAANAEERRILLRTQRLLERKRPVSELFLHDLVGRNFSPPLAFYLDRCASYLRDMRALAVRYGVEWGKPAANGEEVVVEPPRSTVPAIDGERPTMAAGTEE